MPQRQIFTLSRLLQSTSLLAAVLAIYSGYQLYQFRTAHLTSCAPTPANLARQYQPLLLPEVDIAVAIADGSFYDLPDRFIDEMKDIWAAEGELFHTDINTSVLTVQSIMPAGAFGEAYQLPLQRAVALIDSPLSADALFHYMTAADKGFVLIDPLKALQETKRKKRNQRQQQQLQQSPVLSYSWGRGRLELDYEMFHMMWPFSHREFTVLNVMDAEQRVFVSKSVQFPKDVYHNHIAKLRGAHSEADAAAILNGADETGKVVRAVNNFALRISEAPSTSAAVNDRSDQRHKRQQEHPQKKEETLRRYRFEMINFAAGVVPSPSIAHYVNSRLYFPLVVRRMREVLKVATE